MTVLDFTDEISKAYGVEVDRAEGKGRNVLILNRLDRPFKRVDGKIASYMLEHRWLSCDVERKQSWACVQGSDATFWTNREIKNLGALTPEKSLFDCFRLF